MNRPKLGDTPAPSPSPSRVGSRPVTIGRPARRRPLGHGLGGPSTLRLGTQGSRESDLPGTPVEAQLGATGRHGRSRRIETTTSRFRREMRKRADRGARRRQVGNLPSAARGEDARRVTGNTAFVVRGARCQHPDCRACFRQAKPGSSSPAEAQEDSHSRRLGGVPQRHGSHTS